MISPDSYPSPAYLVTTGLKRCPTCEQLTKERVQEIESVEVTGWARNQTGAMLVVVNGHRLVNPSSLYESREEALVVLNGSLDES